MVARAVRDGFLSIVTPGSQISPMSLEIKWEEELRLSIKGARSWRRSCARALELTRVWTGLPSNKELKDLKETLKQKKDEWLDEERERAQGRVSCPSGWRRERAKR